jgi:hypothetical protein
MTAEQKKAKELVEIFLQYVDCGGNRYTTKVQIENAKQCALICVDEILKIAVDFSDDIKWTKSFWQTVRNEIINYK